LIDRPFWVLVRGVLHRVVPGETLYNWLAITAHSVSPLPLFPRYVVNSTGEEWPVQPRLLQIREWLRAQGFRQVQALKAEVGGGIYLRVSVYQDAQALVRVQVTFIPQANGAISVCYRGHVVTGRRQPLPDRQPLHSLRRLLSGKLVRRAPAVAPFAAAAD
jgi:hypothetical protein